MSSPASDIAVFIAASGAGTFAGLSGWAVYVGQEPEAPGNVVTVYDTGGAVADHENGIYAPSIMIRIRAESYLEGYAKAEDIRGYLTDSSSFTANGRAYVGAWQSSDISALGFDDSGRVIFSSNYRLLIEK